MPFLKSLHNIKIANEALMGIKVPQRNIELFKISALKVDDHHVKTLMMYH